MRLDFKSLAKITLLVVVLMGALHVLTSAAVALYALSGSRILDVRQIGEGTKVPAFASAVVASVVSPDDTVAAGSSFTFGFPFDEQFTFTAELNRRGIKSVNIGIQALGLHGVNDWLICAMMKRGLRAKNLIVEIPLINEMAWLPTQTSKAMTIKSCPPTRTVSLFQFALSNPIGTGWGSVLFDRLRLASPTPQISITKVPPGYFATVEDFRRVETTMRTNIKTVYDHARAVSDNVILFVSPVYLDGIERAGADRTAVAEQFNRTQDFCRETAGANCIDLSEFVKNPNNFFNLTHSNGTGAKALADLIAPKIVR